MPKGRTDPERLRASELIYTGVRRTPVCAVLGGFSSAAEVFATMGDVFLLLGLVSEDATDTQTADGRPATKAAAEVRIARMLCADLETSTAQERCNFAENAANLQMGILGDAFSIVTRRLPALPQTILFAGEGEFLIRLALKNQRKLPPCPVVSLSRELGTEISRAACAYAVAMLGAETR